MSIINNRSIAIIGGGPGGLTLARLLQLKGANVKVYERDSNKDARQQGATLDLHHDSGLLALQEAKLMEAFMSNYRPGADRLRIVNKNATVIFEDRDDETAQERQRPEIDRGPLQKILLESLQAGTVIWDSHFLSLDKKNDQWKLEFKNGTSAIADIVIAADGANSKLRTYITDIKPFYCGVTALEGAVYNAATIIPATNQLLNGGKIFAMDDEKTLIVSSKGDGSLVFYTSIKTGENWAKESGIDFTDRVQVLEWFNKTYIGWDKIWQELFENAAGSFIPRPIYCMPLDQTWVTLPNITMLGDAAHLMPPFAGEGVNMAMLDALELSNCLTNDNFNNLHTAIETYEKQMRIRAAQAANDSLESTEQLHSHHAIDFMMQVIN